MTFTLTDREKQILQMVVDGYINNFEPVGSRTISKYSALDLSAATIRNVLSDLESLGLIGKTHTSSGRVPTTLGYQAYVECIMKLQALSADEEKEIQQIREKYRASREKLQNIIQEISSHLSRVAHYPGIVTMPDLGYALFKKVQFVSLGTEGIMVFLITNSDVLERKFSDEGFTQAELNEISILLSRQFEGRFLKDVYVSLKEDILKIGSELSGICKILHIMLRDYFKKAEEQVYIEGALSILENPEFTEFDRIKLFLGFLEKNRDVVEILNKYSVNKDLNIVIGLEEEGLEQFSLVSSGFGTDGGHGSIGVIGPKRMRYDKVVSVVKTLSRELNNILRELDE